MGTVNFVTDVTKSVELFKTVALDVDKLVDSSVNIEGSLATAEASADALGGGGSGAGLSGLLVLDNFDTSEEFSVEDATPGDGPVIADAGTPDGADPVFVAANWERDIAADLTPGGVDPMETIVCLSCQEGESVRPANSIGISSFIYEGDPVDLTAGGGGPTAVQFTYGADLEGAVVTFTFEDATGSTYVVDSGVLDSTAQTPPAPPGREDESIPLDPDNAVWDDLSSVTIDIDGGVFDLDFSIDDVALLIPGGGGVLAETDTFAQVSEDGAFSFSEALAALSPVVEEGDTIA